jgi:hypothetical protein
MATQCDPEDVRRSSMVRYDIVNAESDFFYLDYAHGGPSERRPRLVDVIQN